MNKLRLIALFALLFFPALALAQSTTVSGTVTDANSQAYANGTYRIEFFPGSAAPPYQWNGAPFNPGSYVFTGSLNSSGAFSGVSVPSNAYIGPGTQWKFTFCSAASAPCYSIPLTVSGSTLNVTSSLSPPAIAVAASSNVTPTAYTDAEIVGATVGFQYFNLTSQVVRICTVSIPCTWVTGGGGGGGTVTTSGSPASSDCTYFSGSTVITGTANCTLTSAGAMVLASTLQASAVSAGSALASCGSATGILCLAEGSTAGTPTSAQDYMRANSSTHTFECSLNDGAETPCNPTIPTSASSGDLVSWGTWPAQTDSSVVAANVVTQTGNGATTEIAGYAGTNKVLSPVSIGSGLSLSAGTLSATGGGSGISPTDATQAWGVDDFLTIPSTVSTPFSTLGFYWNHITGTGTVASGTVTTNNPGVVQICTAGASSDAELLHTTSAFGDWFSSANFKDSEFEFTFALSRTTSIAIYVGLYYNTSGFASTPNAFHGWEFLRFDTSQSDTDFTYIANDGSTQSTFATSAAADTNFHTLDIKQTSQGSIVFTLDGGNSDTITKTITAAGDTGFYPFFEILDYTTSAACENIDRFAYSVQGLSRTN